MTTTNPLDKIILDRRQAVALGLGGGLDLMNRVQISVNYNWNFGPVANLSAYKDKVGSIERRNARCLQISLAYMF